MLRPLRTCALRLILCSGMLSGQLACALAHKPEVDGGPPNSLCFVLMSGDDEP